MKKAIQSFRAVMWGMIIVIFSSCSVFITSLVLFMVPNMVVSGLL